MVAFGHTAVGVLIGSTAYLVLGDGDIVNGLLVTGTVGVVSHYLMDSLPHGHFTMPKGYKKGIIPIIIFDLLLSVFVFLSIVYKKSGLGEEFLYMLFGIGGSQLPDVIDGLFYTGLVKPFKLIKLENKFHEGMHWHGREDKTLLIGKRDLWQVLVVLFALFWIIK